MTALACCKHALAKTASPVCTECYQDLLTVARQMRTTLTALANCGCVQDCLPCLKKVNDVAEAFDTLVGEKP